MRRGGLQPADHIWMEAALRLARAGATVVVDGRSHAATLIRPLTDAGVQVTQPSTSDVAVATGQFLDEITGTPVGTVMSRLARARRRLVTQIKEAEASSN